MRKEKTTSELASALGCKPDLIRKWKQRGFLPLSPNGIHGQGRGHEIIWPFDAEDELIAFAATRNYGVNADKQRLTTSTRKNAR